MLSLCLVCVLSRADSGCRLCEYIAAHFETRILRGASPDVLITDASELCELIDDPFCPEFISSRFSGLQGAILDGATPSDACRRIASCKRPRVPPIKKVQRDELGCQLCLNLVSYIERLVLDGGAKAEIEQLASEMCAQLPSVPGTVCKGAIDQGLDDIIFGLRQEVDAFSICAKIDLCAADGKRYTLCGMCQDFVTYVEDCVLRNYTESQIEAAVRELCAPLPSVLGQICNDCIDQVIEDIINWVVQWIDDFGICAKLGFCRSRVMQSKIPAATKSATYVAGSFPRSRTAH
jgi:saposin